MITSKRSGIALISVLAIMAMALVLITALTVISAINGRMINDRLDSQKAYEAADMLMDDVILKFIRYRTINNSYVDWTANCLQISGVSCKMELDLNASGGSVRTWGKSKNSIRKLEATLIVSSEDSVSISNRKEIY